MAGTLASLVVRIGADIKGFTSDLNRATTLSKRESAKMLRSFKRMGVGIGAAYAVAINEAVKFEKAMAEVSTLLDDTSGMDNLTESVRELSMQYGAAPVDTAKALYQIISAGASDAASQMELLTTANKLAIGGVTDVETAADGLTTTLNAYGMSAADAGHVSDLLFVGMKQGKTTIEEMSTSIGAVATIAAQTGVGLDELIAATATLTKSGIATSEAMSGIKGVLAAVMKQSPQAVAMAEEMGVGFNIAAIESEGFAGWLAKVQEATGGSSEKLAKLFGRVEGLTAVMSLGANEASEFNKILLATGDAAGATDEAFGKMSETFDFQMKQIKATGSVMMERIGTFWLPVLNKFASALYGIVDPSRDATLKLKSMSSAVMTVRQARLGTVDALLHAQALNELQAVKIAREIERVSKALEEEQKNTFRTWQSIKKLTVEKENLERQQKLILRQGERVNKQLGSEGRLNEVVVTATKKANIGRVMTAKAYADIVAEANRLASALDRLNREMDPLVGITQTYVQDLQDLDDIAKANGWTAEELAYRQGIVRQKFEDAAWAAQGFDTQLEEITVTAKKMKDVEKSVTGVTAVIENSFKRLDDTFQSFWSNLVKNGKLSLDSIKDLFLDTIAQMLHAALTQPIVLRLGAALTGGLASGAASAAGGGLFAGAAGGAGLAGLFGGFTSIFTGHGIQQAFSNFSNIFSGGAANWQFGLAGLVGGILGKKIFGGQGGIGGGLGAIIGTAFLPGIGSLIGGLLGGALGGLFGDRKPRIFGAGSAAGSGDVTNKGLNATDLGGFFLGGGRGGVGEFRLEAIDALTQFDNAIASFLSADQLSKVTDALSTWSIRLDKSAVTIENLLDSRFAVILSSFSQNVQDYVGQFSGLEAQTEALQKYVTALNTVGMAIAAFADSNPADTLAEQLENAATTSTEKLTLIGGALEEMFGTFDGTPEQMMEIAQLIDARYRGELEYLAAIDQLVKGIAQSIEAQQNKIREAVEGPKTFGQLIGDAESLYRSLGAANSPEEIAAIVAQIQSLVDKAFGGLDTVGQAAQAQFLIDFLDDVERVAASRAGALATDVITEGELLREQAIAFGETINAPMELNTAAVDNVSATIDLQTEALQEEHGLDRLKQDDLLTELRLLNGKFDTLFDSAPRTIGA